MRRFRRLFGIGLLAGLGWWINPMILSYLAAAGVFLLFSPRRWLSRWLWVVPLAFLLGSLPSWIFNMTHSFWSFVLFRKGAEGDFRTGLRKAAELLPQIAGVDGVYTDPVPFLSPAAGVVYLLLLGILLVDLCRRSPGQEPHARVRRRGIQLLLLFSIVHLGAFCSSGYVGVAVPRYLFPLYSSIPILTGMAILRLWNWSRPLAIGALVVLLLNNSLALWKMVEFYETNREATWWKPEPVIALLQAEGVSRAYAHRRIGPRLTFETQERLVVTDPLKERYPRYLEWADAAPRIAFILSRKYGPARAEFEPALQGIGATYQRKEFGDFSVFYDFRPPFEGRLVSLSPVGWRAESEPPGSDPARAFDRQGNTAWLSEAALTPGMWYRLDLGRLVPVGGISILPIRAWTGTPRGYRIELSPDGTAWEPVASVPAFRVALRWRNGQPRMDPSGPVVSHFAPRPTRFIRITQTGENREQWWAISELFVYQPSAGPVGERPEAAAHLREAIRFESAERWGAALAAYEHAVRADPDWEEAHWRIVQTYERAGLPMEGRDPYTRGLVFERLGMPARAAREYESLLGQDPEDGEHSDPLRRLAELYRQQGDAQRATRVERRLGEQYAPPMRAEARFGEAVRLFGYGFEPTQARAGEEVRLAYYWQALRPMAEDYAVFVHFVRDGRVLFGQDHEPLHGRYPTRQWKQGEMIREHYRVRLPRDLPAGEYEISIGLWNPHAKKHLGKRVRLTTFRVLPSG